jgi:hypothetical protein
LLARHGVGLILGFGVACRVAEYLANRSLWLDEASLASNIRRKSLSGLFGPLFGTQLAPPGFLTVEWAVAHTLGHRDLFLRLLPLACGVASLFLFRRVASRWLDARAALIALGLFAVSDDLIYYSAELKPYSSDVALGLACYLVALEAESRPLTVGRVMAFGAFGASVIWFSYTAVFILAGAGVILLWSAIAERRWKRAGALGLLGLVCAVSLAGLYEVSLNQLEHRRDMWVFWAFAFPPRPVTSPWDATWAVRRFLYLFVNPLDFGTPFSPRLSALVPVAMFLTGSVSLFARDKKLFGLLALPALLTLLAAFLRLYPFHGRLLLFLVPSLLLLIAEGTGRVRRGVPLWLVLVALFLYPTMSAAYHLVEPRPPRDFNPYGDRRPTKLDPGRFPL